MNRTSTLSCGARSHLLALALALPIVGATACGAATPTPQLKAAQQAYGDASTGPARAYAPDSLKVARDSLGRAEHANQSNDTQQRSFAHLAQSRAELADARGRTALAVQERDASRTQLAQLQTQQAQRVAAACQAQQQRGAGVTAMQANALDSIADRKEALRGGMVYIVSSGLTFQKNEATLSPEAKNKLDKVADAIKQAPPATTVIVEGFTDPSGGAAINNPLSERRARSVADYLKTRGVSGTVRTRGLGSSQPVGDNATHQGRAENRRVQVIINPR